ncbi:hypothetical protein JXA40_12500 [bacterium]|nr:hypothetical protein [candidate division CSSED10-310 bacterium]
MKKYGYLTDRFKEQSPVFQVVTATVMLMILITVPVLHADIKELKNDGYIEGGSAYYQQGFVAGEIMAAKFTADPADYPYQLTMVRVLVGDGGMGGTTGAFVLHIWEDTGATAPGTALITPESFQLTAGFWNEITLPTPIAVTSGDVRVGLEFFLDPPPSFFRDADGNITPHYNFIFAVPGGWFYAEDLGLQGDWILRIRIDTGGTSPTATPALPTNTPPPFPTHTPFPTGTAAPTYTQLPTNTPLPTNTGLPTGSASPSSTPSAPPTDTPVATSTALPPSPTPTAPETPWVELWMPSHYFTPGDPCALNAMIHNPGDPIQNCRLIVFLILGDGVWFWPTWGENLNSQLMTIDSGLNTVMIIPEFLWPTGAGSYSPILFIGAVTDSGYWNFLAIPDIWNFGFGE